MKSYKLLYKMKSQKGFIQTMILIAVIIAVLVICGGFYFGVKKYQNYQLDNLLTIFAKIGLSLVAVFFTLRWFIVVPYIWFKYDSPILKLKKELNEFKNEQRGKPITQSSIDGSIRQKTIIVNEKLEIMETQRKLFIDRVNLILSISSISKS